MKEFFEYIIKNLVDTPDDVNVNVIEGEVRTIVEISVGSKDVGKLVGKEGKTINALRTIAATLGARFGRKVRLELIQ